MVKFVTNASSATWWPKLEPMLIALHVGQIWNQFWWHHLVVKFSTNTSGTTYNWPNLEPMQVAFYLAGEITQVIDFIPWVRCASGNVFFYICHCPISPQKKDVKMYQCLPGNDERMSDVRAPPRLGRYLKIHPPSLPARYPSTQPNPL